MYDSRKVEAVEGRLPGTDRTIRIYFQRSDWKEFYDFTDGELQDAAREIETAFKYFAGGMGYGVMDANRTDKAHDGREHLEARMMDILSAYKEWANDSEVKTKGIVLDVCAFGFTYKQVAFQRDVSPQTIMRRLQDGLGAYAKIRGWGK